MTLEELKTILDTTHLKVSYSSVPLTESLPNIVYYQNEVRNFAADGIVYFSRKRVSVSLYAKTRDQADEALVEDAFTANGIYWTKTVEYDDDQKLYITEYDITI